MISCKIIQGDTGVATAYYAKAFNEDGPLRADNYYANEKAGATWQGDGAKLLGIEGKEVTAKDFCAALNGVILNPVTGEIQNLADNPRGDRRRNGYDFTMAPPKSVSIAGLALGDQRVLNAHLKANDAAMKWLQEYASVIRVKDDGRNVKVNAGNLLWATVLHQTNRENEPQIHSHNVIMAVVFDHTNEKWRSLTNSALLKLRATADKVYQNELAIELKNIGYSLEYNKHSFEIQGISREQIEGFSSRKLMADEKLREAGIDPETATWKQRQMAILATRVAKMEHPRDILQAYWSERVAELGIDPAIVPEARHRLDDPVVLYKGLKQEQHTPAATSNIALPENRIAELDELATSGLIDALGSTTRETRLLGNVPDPVAQEVLNSHSVKLLDRELVSQGFRDLRPLAAGASSVVLDAGDKVVRIGLGEGATRPNIPEMLQALRSGTVGVLRYEILPKIDTHGISEADVQAMETMMKERGYRWDDAAADNLGRQNGRLVISDPGGISQVVPTVNTSVGLLMTTDINVAQKHAGDSGRVIEKSVSFNKLLAAENLAEAREFLGLDRKVPLDALVDKARSNGYDGITFNTQAGREYILIEANSKEMVPGQRGEVVTVGAVEDHIKREASKAVGWAISHLSECEQAFDRREIVAAALDFVKGKDVDLGALEAAIGGYVSKGELVHRESDDKFTTPRGMNAERTLLSVVASCKDKGNTVLSSLGEFDQALKTFEIRKSAELGQEFKLTSEQVAAARNILLHPDALQGVQGDAGTGKTVGLEFVKEVAESRGWQVMGMATSANAATELGHSSGIESETIAMFQVRHTEQLSQLQEELAGLRETLKAEGLLIDGGAPVIEQQKLVIEGGQKAAWYTFDHLRGDVYKSPRTLRNQVGYFLKDVGGWPTTTNHGNDLLGRLKTSGQEALGRLSEKMITYRPAGLAESVSAQAALAAQSGGVDPRMKTYYAKVGELKNLQNSGNTQGKPMLLVMDEASMSGVRDASMISALGAKYGARMVFQGDTKQHGSVAAGRTFLQAMQAGMHTSKLTVTRRFDQAVEQVKDGLELFRQRRFREAIRSFNRIEVSEDALVKRVGQQYQESFTALKSQGKADPAVGVVALTNRDRKAINAEIHEVRQSMGLVAAHQVAMKHLDDPKLTQAQQRFVSVMQEKHVDAFLFSKTYRERGIKNDDLLRLVSYDVEKNLVRAENAAGKAITFSPKQQDYFKPFVLEERQYAVGDQVEARWNIKDDALKVKINNGTRGVVKSVDASGVIVTWQQNSGPLEMKLDSRKAMFIDHAYAHTSYKEQGATTDQTIFAVSQTGARVINQESAYVGVTRARQDTILVTSDMATIERNVGTESKKTSAFEIPQGVLNSINVESLPDAYIRQVAAITAREQDSPADRSLATGKNESREKDKAPEKTIDRGLSL